MAKTSKSTKIITERKIETLDVMQMVSENYMEYSKSTITERMFPFIDGLKPVQRRILIAMYNLKLVKGKTIKSSKIVGDTMGDYHPHGDFSIYEALAHMTDMYDGQNAPLIKGDGTFGKQWSGGKEVETTVPCASARYTEAGLSDLTTATFFGGLDENAVNVVDNYLLTKKEPTLLPTAFPNILVGTTKGIACGLGTWIPSYGLKEVCNATIGLLENTIHDETELAMVLGVPDFSTGGKVGISKKQLLDLCTIGHTKGIVLTSKYVMENKTTMLITEIPFNTTVEKIIVGIDKLMTLKVYPNITGVTNATGDMVMGIKVTLQRGTDPAEAFQYLCAFTDVQKKIAFSTKFVKWRDDIQNYDLYICGVYDLLVKHWIPWRLDVLKRIHTFRLEKAVADEVRYTGWLKIDGATKEYLSIIADNKKADAIQIHKQRFGLTDEEEQAIISRSAASYTQDEVEKSKAQLAEIRAEQARLQFIIDNDSERAKMCCDELKDIRDTFGKNRRSEVEGIHTTVSLNLRKKEKVVQEVYVGVTAEFFLKRADNEAVASTFDTRINGSDQLTHIYKMLNTDKLLVFTTFGFVYKIDVDNIDNVAKTKFKDTVWNLVARHADDKGEPFMVIPAGNYDYEFNIVYPHTAVRKIKTSMYTGRNVYKDAFPGFVPDKCIITEKDELLLITEDWKIHYANLNKMGMYASPNKKQLTLNLPNTLGTEIKYVLPIDELANFGVEQATYYGTGFVPMRRADIQKKAEIAVKRSKGAEIICGLEVETVKYDEVEEFNGAQEVTAESVELADNLTPEEVIRLLDSLDEQLGEEDDYDEDEESDLD